MKSKRFIVLGSAVALLLFAAIFILRKRDVAAPRGTAASSEKKILYWWDPMLGPSSISDKPGKSAMGMDMEPVYEGDASAGAMVVIDPAVVQNMGVRTAKVGSGPLDVMVRAVGMLDVAQSATQDVSLRVGGWVEKLYADTDGMHVGKGEVLFDLYSPELQVAEEELILAGGARRALRDDASDAVKKEADDLLASARRKLSLWGVAEEDISAIAAAQRAPKSVPFRSPADGHIVDKAIVQGSAVEVGAKLMRIEDHSRLWLDAQVYEDQIPLVAVGSKVEATVDGLPGKTIVGKVEFIYPHLDHMDRTELVRTTLENSEAAMKPGMFASVRITARVAGDAMLAPREAVIDTGTRKIVFVQVSEGHFDSRVVTTGLTSGDDQIQILDGLRVGEVVVTSGQFLMDVESRTNEAIKKFRGDKSGGMP